MSVRGRLHGIISARADILARYRVEKILRLHGNFHPGCNAGKEKKIVKSKVDRGGKVVQNGYV